MGAAGKKFAKNHKKLFLILPIGEGFYNDEELIKCQIPPPRKPHGRYLPPPRIRCFYFDKLSETTECPFLDF